MTSPASAFGAGSTIGTALNTPASSVKIPQYSYPTYTPATPPNYVTPVINNVAPNEQEFASAQDMESQDYNNEAIAQVQQAGIAMQQAGLTAYQTAFTAGQAISSEASQYTGAGVTLQGSPMLVLEQTRQQGLQEVNMIQAQGLAQANLGTEQAFQTINSGRSTLLGQQSQFDQQVASWATQGAQNQIQSITQQQGQLAQFTGQNTANIINAYNQRQPIPQVTPNNSLAQSINSLGQLAGNSSRISGVSGAGGNNWLSNLLAGNNPGGVSNVNNAQPLADPPVTSLNQWQSAPIPGNDLDPETGMPYNQLGGG
jgi:hypothetical protein